MTTRPRRPPFCAALPVLAALAGVAGCAKEPAAPEGEAAPAAPALTVEQFERRSPSAGAVEAFNAVCAEPERRAVARQAARRGFGPVPPAKLREEMPDAVFPPDAAVWRGPEEAGGALLVWDGATATCEVRAEGLDPLVVDAEFTRLPQVLEESGSAVARLRPAPAPVGAPRTRQMLLVSPAGSARPERARVLRLNEGAGERRGAVSMTARGVAATRNDPPAAAAQ